MDDRGTQIGAASVVRWRKLGLVFRPDGARSWAQTHAQLPTPLHLGDSTYRIYFASRDAQNRSHVGFFDLDLERPERPLRVTETPVLAPGPLGYFDDHGIYPASVVDVEGEIRLYTIGWNPGIRPPLFYSSIGLAISRDGGETFSKLGRAPIMTRSEYDACLVTSPWVLRTGAEWRMWYVSGYAWSESEGQLESHYHVKYADSADGVAWRREGRICLDHVHPGEKNIARACVLPPAERGKWEAWYSFAAGGGYRIGYATSSDGLAWIRQDEAAGITTSPSGWDSEAIAYPAVVRHRGRRFMFYNGNGFGRDGVGLAIEQAEA